MLNLEKNQLSRIDSMSFKMLTNLKELKLAQNQIFFQDHLLLFGLSDVETLDLSVNCILALDDKSLSDLFNLKELLLQKNVIKNVGALMLKNVHKLERLVMYDNQIEAIDTCAFLNLKILKHLDLSSNFLTILSDINLFSGLINLETLNLASNQIAQIESFVFQPLWQLRELNLSGNRLNLIKDPLIFVGLETSLKLLFLNDNQITFLNVNTFKKLKHLKYLDISENLIIEDSQVESLKQALTPIQTYVKTKVGANSIEEIARIKNLRTPTQQH